jgi:hypothetical protein
VVENQVVPPYLEVEYREPVDDTVEEIRRGAEG